MFEKVLKANPHHDERGRFTSKDKAKVSTWKDRADLTAEFDANPLLSGVGDKEKKSILDSAVRVRSSVGAQSTAKVVGDYTDHPFPYEAAWGQGVTDKGAKLQEEVLKGKTKKDLVVYRGVNGASLNSMVSGVDVGGVISTEKNFISTSASKDVANLFKDQDGHVLVISLPKGSHALNAHSLASEVLLPAGTTLRVSRKDGKTIYVEADTSSARGKAKKGEGVSLDFDLMSYGGKVGSGIVSLRKILTG